VTAPTRRLFALGALSLAAPVRAADDPTAGARRRMVANIEPLAAAGAAGGRRRIDPRVLQVMREVPRHLFVPAAERSRAYSDGALYIGHDSTISQPFVVAVMTDLLRLQPEHSVLEVGAGSGYQAAILSRLARRVHTIEIVGPLAERAARQLAALGHRNVSVREGDGYKGWPEHAPFDAIIVTAGATHVPKPLIVQLKPGGRMVIPVGSRPDNQQLMVVSKDAKGRVFRRRVMAVNFIPLQEPTGAAP